MGEVLRRVEREGRIEDKKGALLYLLAYRQKADYDPKKRNMRQVELRSGKRGTYERSFVVPLSSTSVWSSAGS
jgi:hypothetical protein